MTRVTFGNNKQYDYIHYNCRLLQIGLTDRFGQSEYYPYDSIKRVEKQVKDLSSEEFWYYAAKKYKSQLNYIEIMKSQDCVKICLKGLDDDVLLSFEEFVDITDFVKGIKGIINNGRSN